MTEWVKDGLQSDQSNTWNCVEWGVSKRSEYLCQGKPRYRFVRSSVFRKIFPTEIVLGFNLWGRGVVPRKCILAGTLLKPSWNYLGTFAEACWNHVGICRNLARTFLKLWLEPPGTILTARWETLVAFRFGAYCFRFFFLLRFNAFWLCLMCWVLSGNGEAGRTLKDEALLLGTCCWYSWLESRTPGVLLKPFWNLAGTFSKKSWHPSGTMWELC